MYVISFYLARFNSFIIGTAVFAYLAVMSQGYAAEVELGDSTYLDGLANAFVIVRNNDQPRGYSSVTVDCVFSRNGRPVGEASDQIRDLKFHEHIAVRLSTPVQG